MKTFELLQMHILQLEICIAFTGKLEKIAVLINYGCKATYWCFLSSLLKICNRRLEEQCKTT